MTEHGYYDGKDHSTHIEGEWLVPTHWHIDDVRERIKGSQYENEPMPSDEKLMDYLFNVVGGDYWIELINEQLEMNLGDLFEREVRA